MILHKRAMNTLSVNVYTKLCSPRKIQSSIIRNCDFFYWTGIRCVARGNWTYRPKRPFPFFLNIISGNCNLQQLFIPVFVECLLRSCILIRTTSNPPGDSLLQNKYPRTQTGYSNRIAVINDFFFTCSAVRFEIPIIGDKADADFIKISRVYRWFSVWHFNEISFFFNWELQLTATSKFSIDKIKQPHLQRTTLQQAKLFMHFHICFTFFSFQFETEDLSNWRNNIHTYFLAE